MWNRLLTALFVEVENDIRMSRGALLRRLESNGENCGLVWRKRSPMIADAVAAGADVYVTGDVKYHDFTTFCDRISIADIGHYESEQCAKEILADVIRSRVPEVAVYFAESDENVIKYI